MADAVVRAGSHAARLTIDLDLVADAPAWLWECVTCGYGSEIYVDQLTADGEARAHFEVCAEEDDDDA